MVATQGCSHEGDSLGIEIDHTITFDVHADLDHPHQLHQIDRHLAATVPRYEAAEIAFLDPQAAGDDDAVTIGIQTPASSGEGHRLAVGLVDGEGTEGTPTVADRIDRDRRHALSGERRSDKEEVRILARTVAMGVDHHRPATRRPRPGR